MDFIQLNLKTRVLEWNFSTLAKSLPKINLKYHKSKKYIQQMGVIGLICFWLSVFQIYSNNFQRKVFRKISVNYSGGR